MNIPKTPLELEVTRARANGRIYSTEAMRIVELAKQGGLTQGEKDLLEQLSTDSFSSKPARQVFADALGTTRSAPSLKPR